MKAAPRRVFAKILVNGCGVCADSFMTWGSDLPFTLFIDYLMQHDRQVCPSCVVEIRARPLFLPHGKREHNDGDHGVKEHYLWNRLPNTNRARARTKKKKCAPRGVGILVVPSPFLPNYLRRVTPDTSYTYIGPIVTYRPYNTIDTIWLWRRIKIDIRMGHSRFFTLHGNVVHC